MLALTLKRYETLHIGEDLHIETFGPTLHGKHADKLKIRIYDTKRQLESDRYLVKGDRSVIEVGTEKVEISYVFKKGRQYRMGIAAPLHMEIYIDDEKTVIVPQKEVQKSSGLGNLREKDKKELAWFFN